MIEIFVENTAAPETSGVDMAPNMGVPASKKKRKYETFKVSDEVFHKFRNGKTKFERWSKYLDLNKHRMRQARIIGAWIYCFPFVRGVYLSGSLSKWGIQSRDDDIDFFILSLRFDRLI